MRRGKGSGARRTSDVAVLRFRHDATGSGVSRQGHVRPGGRLEVEYDPARMAATPSASGAEGDIICHVRFVPGGQSHTGTVPKTVVPSAHTVQRDSALAFGVPSDATNVEIWFERRGAESTLGWDSRYGQNYSFAVVAEGLPVPEPSVAPRAEAVVDRGRIRVVDDAASKKKVAIGPGGRSLHTGLVIRALIVGTAAPKDVWADLHVFDAADELIHTGSVTLSRQELTADGQLFTWQDDVYEGTGGGSGMGAWHRPDAHTIQYRLYCRMASSKSQTDEQMLTDGILHEFEVPADQEVVV